MHVYGEAEPCGGACSGRLVGVGMLLRWSGLGFNSSVASEGVSVLVPVPILVAPIFIYSVVIVSKF